MPPAKKRARSYDPARTRAAVLAQLGHLRQAVGGLTPGQLALPTRLGGLTAGELVAHIGEAVADVGRAVAAPAPLRQDVQVVQWPSRSACGAAAADAGVRDLAARHPDPGAFLEEAERDLRGLLAAHPAGRLVRSDTGALPLDDYLVTRAVELVVHTDDLNAAVSGLDVPCDRQALAAATRLLLDALALRAPGGTTEVRVPPYAVVQCVEGPRHTRGTPPNVVETDPLTWIRLATGRTSWSDALGRAEVSASGERADLSQLLPLMD
ncbi:sterol carrier family protein [Streptomyces sp. NPDC090108]|uniref:sterol carrier family protein n=1 Tax=Streptomyces sp. NPDC090108 TaxID=3365947 RepID=UPI003817967E